MRFFSAPATALHAALWTAALLLSSCSGSTNQPAAQTPTGTPGGEVTLGTGEPVGIERVVDGDSIELIVGDTVVKARLQSLNAAELYDDNDALTCAGVTAKETLEAFLATGPVLASGDETDRFGRRLVDLSVNGQSAAATVIEQGWALASTDVGTAQPNLMLEAATAGRGMWGAAGCGAPLVDTIRIGDQQLDAPGSDSDNLTEEWVAITNIGPAVVDLTGWTLRDRTTSHQYVFGSVLLPPDTSVRVRTGSGTDSHTDLYWGESFPVWSNENEVILVVDPQGIMVDWWFDS